MSQNWSLYALVKPYETFWRMNIMMMKICHLFHFKCHSLMKMIELIPVTLQSFCSCVLCVTPGRPLNTVYTGEGFWMLWLLASYWTLMTCSSMPWPQHQDGTWSINWMPCPCQPCHAFAELMPNQCLGGCCPLAVEICWSTIIVLETYNWVEVALWLIYAPNVPLTEFKQNILCNSNCLFFLWFDATFYCRTCFESVATHFPKAFMSIAIPVLSITVYFTMLQPMVDTLHDVSFAMCALARCHSWKLAFWAPQSMDSVNVSYICCLSHPFNYWQVVETKLSFGIWIRVVSCSYRILLAVAGKRTKESRALSLTSW